MATCGTCKKLILFGGVKSGEVQYCSRSCASAAQKADLKPPSEVSPKNAIIGRGVAAFVWAVVAVLASLFNFGLDLRSWAAGTPPGNAYYASLGYALMPFLSSGVVLFFREHRNARSYFKAAGIFSLLLLFSSFGKIKPPNV